jgi:hypothetical protein
MPGDSATGDAYSFTTRVLEFLGGLGLVAGAMAAAPAVGTGMALAGGIAGIGLAVDGGRNMLGRGGNDTASGNETNDEPDDDPMRARESGRQGNGADTDGTPETPVVGQTATGETDPVVTSEVNKTPVEANATGGTNTNPSDTPPSDQPKSDENVVKGPETEERDAEKGSGKIKLRVSVNKAIMLSGGKVTMTYDFQGPPDLDDFWSNNFEVTYQPDLATTKANPGPVSVMPVVRLKDGDPDKYEYELVAGTVTVHESLGSLDQKIGEARRALLAIDRNSPLLGKLDEIGTLRDATDNDDQTARERAIEGLLEAVAKFTAEVAKVKYPVDLKYARGALDGLNPPEVADETEDKDALAGLAKLREGIAIKLEPEQPSAENLTSALAEIEQYHRDKEGLERTVAERLARARQKILDDADGAVKESAAFGPVDPELVKDVTGKHGALQSALPAAGLTKGMLEKAELVLTELQALASDVAKQLGELDSVRRALDGRLNQVQQPNLPDQDWAKAAATAISDARDKARNAVDMKLLKAEVGQAEPLVQTVEDMVALVPRATDIANMVAGNIGKLNIYVDATDTEQQTLAASEQIINTGLGLMTDAGCKTAEDELKNHEALTKEIAESKLAFTAEKEQAEKSIAEFSAKFNKQMALVKQRNITVDFSVFGLSANEIRNKQRDNVSTGRGACAPNFYADLVAQFEGLCESMQSSLDNAATTVTAKPIPKIGYVMPGDLGELYTIYTDIGGKGEQNQLLTVCGNSKKAGGHYTYKGVKYEMYHDSHGLPSADNSRTAWKIMVEGQLQVVGVGYHNGKAYRAIFPHVDTKDEDYPAQAEVVDPRT